MLYEVHHSMKATAAMERVELYSALNRHEHPVCSICVANYNGLTLLDECLGSVLSQQGVAGVEIIVHDDASSDASVALIRSSYPQIELLASRENVGFCMANNRMVAHARGEFVLLLNNDATLNSGALAALVNAAREQASACILTLPQYDWKTAELVDRGCLLDPFYNPVPNLDPTRREVAMVIGACLFMPRALWQELGGFPEWMGSIAEDMYICSIARLRGLEVAVLPDSGYRHHQGASFGGNRVDSGRLSTTFRRRRLSEQNKTAVMLTCTPTLVVWPLLGLHLIELLLEGAILSGLCRDRRIWTQIYAPSFAHLAKNFSHLRKRRKQVQLSRRVSLRRYARCMVLLPRKLVMLLRYGLPTLK